MLLLAVNDFPPLLGGEATLYHGLARHLGREEALVLAPRAAGDQAIDAGLPIEVVRRWLPGHGGGIRRVARALFGGIHLTALLLRRRFDYLVCGQLLSIGAPMAVLARLWHVRYAVLVHGADLADYADREPWRRLARFILSHAHTVVANSRFTASLVDRLLPGAARRIIVLPMGVDPAPTVSPERVRALRSEYALGEGPVLLSVSRLIPMKGHDIVIEALPRLLGRFPDLSFLIVGDGPNRAALQDLARARGVSARVIFAGRVPPGALPAHYALATLFVQLSRETGRYDGLEGFGLSLLEAASFGVPSVAGRTGGVSEAVAEGESGLLVPPEDVETFAVQVERLLSRPVELKRLADGARRWAASHPWEATARCLRSLGNGG
ncbi:MAG TPA: glycosyltransferase family 4 protein [Candidatus Polarisedimenticolia bacterium]|jgi:phosphatidylinositol alpha-1,6-mannosyltransferase|nr:glycosyltransferase family 4 protein [Candidatus Polarisedimenticolia bacterium]